MIIDHDLIKRLMRNVVARDMGYDTPCWRWLGVHDKYGYGRIKHNGRFVPVHWVLKGKPAEGLETDHLCFVRDCVRPDHLEHVTHTENNRRRRAFISDEGDN